MDQVIFLETYPGLWLSTWDLMEPLIGRQPVKRDSRLATSCPLMNESPVVHGIPLPRGGSIPFASSIPEGSKRTLVHGDH
jgi:hypothetical protein